MLSIDMVVATPCNSLTASSSLDQVGGMFSPVQENVKKDPTRRVIQICLYTHALDSNSLMKNKCTGLYFVTPMPNLTTEAFMD